MTPLLAAAHNGRFIAVKALVNAGADTNAITDVSIPTTDALLVL